MKPFKRIKSKFGFFIISVSQSNNKFLKFSNSHTYPTIPRMNIMNIIKIIIQFFPAVKKISADRNKTICGYYNHIKCIKIYKDLIFYSCPPKILKNFLYYLLSTFQRSLAYSRIVRSLENLPQLAVFLRHLYPNARLSL